MMSMRKAIALGLLIPLGLSVAIPASAMGGSDRERPVFSELDANGDGTLTLEELQAHREARFADTDTDGNGQLSRDEMIAAATARIAEGIDRRFERFDDNEDGFLSANELDDMRPRGPNPERVFGRMDADGDGVVSEAEFDEAIARFQQRFHGHGHGRNQG